MNAPAAPFLSVIVPTLGARARLEPLLHALEDQTLPRERFELLLVLDGCVESPALRSQIERLGGVALRLPERRGPGAARNAGAERARGLYLAFTEDDVLPAPDWLERAFERLSGDPSIDVLEGATRTPDGRPTRAGGETPHYLPTNLFVRRELYRRLGGYCERYFDARHNLYFREDSDFGFVVEGAGARVVRAEEVRVTHPIEHPRWADPLRWARRYEMDALLEARHPDRFRERIEVRRVGPFRVRRVVVRASALYATALLAAAAAWMIGRPGTAGVLAAAAAAAFLPVWAKWRFDPLRLPILLLVPFVLVGSYLAGRVRVRALPSDAAPRRG